MRTVTSSPPCNNEPDAPVIFLPGRRHGGFHGRRTNAAAGSCKKNFQRDEPAAAAGGAIAGDFFRQLVVMSPAERNNSLTNRSPEARARILAKVREYQALGPDERELRLRATELRWYLTPLLRSPATERATRLAQVPPDLRELAKTRLTQWDLLPPPLQQEFLANDKTLHYFAHVEATTLAALRVEPHITDSPTRRPS